MLITIILSFVIVLIFVAALSFKLLREKETINQVCSTDATYMHAPCAYCGGDRGKSSTCLNRSDV